MIILSITFATVQYPLFVIILSFRNTMAAGFTSTTIAGPTNTLQYDTSDAYFTGINQTENSINGSTQQQTRDEFLVKIEITIQAAILFLAVLGNSLVLLVLCLRRKKLSRMNLLIVHLSLADLFVAIFNVLPQLIWDITFRFQGNDFLCRSVKFFQVVAMYASSYVLVTTAIDRYLAICHPLTSHTWSGAKVHMMAGVAWALSLAFSIPQIVIFGYREFLPGVSDCWAVFKPLWTVKLYVTWFFLAVYVIPSCVLAFAYGRICFVVWRSVTAKESSTKRKNTSHKSSNNGLMGSESHENGKLLKQSTSVENSSKKSSSNPRAHVRSLSRAKLKTVKLTLTVIICYLVCWSPFFIAQMWGVWDSRPPFTGNVVSSIYIYIG